MTLGGQPQYLEVIPYDFFQITSPINKQNRKHGDPAHTLARDNAQHAHILTQYMQLVEPLQARDAKGVGNQYVFDDHKLIVWHNKQSTGEIRVQDDIAPTMTKTWGTGGNNVPFVGIRRLTPTECERLQGFPDGWTDGQADTQRYKQLGNAVAVPVVEWIMKRIMENL